MMWSWISRRGFLRRLTGTIGATAASSAAPLQGHAYADTSATFAHGIASGDPGTSSVIIWTRITPKTLDPVDVRWFVATDAGFKHGVKSGSTSARPSADFTVKVDVQGLQPDTRYFYRFEAADIVSPAGRTKTLPDKASNVGALKLAVVSCSHYAFGFFHVYRELSTIPDLDAVVHLGDYIYEYGPDGYGGDTGRAIGRSHKPPREIVNLSDYRTRYAQYRSDKDLQAAHAHAPFITSWDDHETANNSWRNGAGNHQPDAEGGWEDRRTAALRAYFEWMPVREPKDQPDPFRFYRTFRWGKLATLHMLETRLTARDEAPSYSDIPDIKTVYDLSDPDDPKPLTADTAVKPAAGSNYVSLPTPFDTGSVPPEPVMDYALAKSWADDGLPVGFTYLPDTERFRHEVIEDPARQMLGQQQEAWLASELQASTDDGVAWQILGNQVIMARMNAPDYTKAFPADILDAASGYTRKWIDRTALGLPINLDSWDGYPVARDRLYDAASDADANLIVLTGDTHHFWANNLLDRPDGTPIGVEFATSSITSQGGYDYIGTDPRVFDIAEAQMSGNVEEVFYCETRHRGWILLDVRATTATADYMTVSDVQSQNYDVGTAKRLKTEIGSPGLSEHPAD